MAAMCVKACGKISYQPSRVAFVFLRKQSKIVSEGEDAIEHGLT
jgi:hypothetical protein